MSQLELRDWIDLSPDLEPDYVEELSGYGQICCFDRNEHLYHQGDPANHIYILRSGTVRATSVDANGCEWLLRLHGPGSMMGIEAIRADAFRDAKLMALEQVETIRFFRDEFLCRVRQDGNLGVALAQLLVKRVATLHIRVGGVAGHCVEQRLAGALLQLYAEAAMRVPSEKEPILNVTHEELATLVLSQRQYVTAILRMFVSTGLIENKRRLIRILHPEGLYEIFSGDNSAPHGQNS